MENGGGNLAFYLVVALSVGYEVGRCSNSELDFINREFYSVGC